jgi:protein phosphatase
MTAARGRGVETLIASWRERDAETAGYVEAYRRYCWTVNGLADLRVAPFHLLASEGRVHTDTIIRGTWICSHAPQLQRLIC